LGARDPTTATAFIRLEGPATQPVIRPATGARVGQIVLALGMPGPAVTAALGVISAAGGEWRTWAGGRIDQYLRLDVAVYDGFSGGALANAAGEVIGMNSSGLSRASAMTIPLATVVRVAEQLLKTGRVARGYIGVGLQAVRLPTGIAAQLSPTQDVGLMVVSLDEGAPAAAAGIQLGDTIVSFDGRAVTDPGEMLGLLTGERVGTTAAVTLVRAGQVHTTTLTIGERPRASRR